MKKISTRAVLLLLLPWLLTGCGNLSTPSVSSDSNSSMPLSSGASTPATSDILRVGDTLTIRLSGIPTEEAGMALYEQTVNDQGNISMPYVGEFHAAGGSTAELKQRIEAAYRDRKIYTTPNITILTQQRFVNVNGEVRTPQRVVYTSDLTALKAITACGGFTDYADKRKIMILRNQQVIPFNAVEALKNPSTDTTLQAGDQIQISRSIF